MQAGTLPPVSFVKPDGIDNEHPNYTNVVNGELHVRSLLEDIRTGPNWSDTAVIVTYDENGGFWDHVAPPVDRVTSADLEAAMLALPEASRTVLLLDLEGFDEGEAAAVLGCAPGTIKSRLFRARAALRELLKDYAPVRRLHGL